LSSALAWRLRRVAPLSLMLLVTAATVGSHSAAGQRAITTDDLRDFYPRSIGPAVTGGRVHDVEALPGDPSTIYVATASGGLWKSTNRGQSWTNVFDTMAVSTFGDVALAPSDPQILYAGTGEQNNRQSSSYGNGVYRSDDGGTTWSHLGLEETRHIGKVEVHPTDPDVAYVAALGNLWAPSEERGVYKTTDGGRSWTRALFVDLHTGVVDLVMDPSDPNVLYAAAYQRMRRTWGFNGGGPGSGIYKTTDAGASWRELRDGLPRGDKGRIGLAISASNPSVLNALVESADTNTQGTYRTEDSGDTWQRVSQRNGRPMYYSHIFIDPNDEDRVYTLATRSHVSRNGGRTWSQIAPSPTYDVGVHADHHALWIDPSDPEHLYLGGDAGMHESYDGGLSFRRLNNFPIAQLYAVAVDMRDPYWVYGGLQDNHSFMGPSETRRWAGILNDDWMQTGFGDGMYWQVDPRDARYAYGSSNGGTYFRYDTGTGDMLDISPSEPPNEEHRFDWTSPMMLSDHDPDRVYVAGNRLFVSDDRGDSWEWTEDLSRGIDRDELELMGVRGADITLSRNDGAGGFGEAVTLDESPLDRDVLWVGFDDGNLQVSRDGGGTWSEVSANVPGIADGTYVSRVAASRRSPGTAYASFDGHRDGDFRPYLFRTDDFGVTWTPLHLALPALGVVNVIVEHPDNPRTLFLGTEHHAFASTDAGASWARIPNLPTTHYDDMVVHPRERDLVLATHGRGVWILDDIGWLAEWEGPTGTVRAFPAAAATIRLYRKDTSYRAQAEFAGTNPVDGVEITYVLGPGESPALLTVADAEGSTIREIDVPAGSGAHRVNWDLRHSPPEGADRWERHENEALARPIEGRGPWVSPGRYTVTIEARGADASIDIEVRGDPDMPITVAMYEVRERFMLDTRELLTAMLSVPIDADYPDLDTSLRAVQRVYDSLNGSGVEPGTLYPPTQSQRQVVDLARERFELLSQETGNR
jgi:photosystem II stability/assembly factor-like uncharacterized protein